MVLCVCVAHCILQILSYRLFFSYPPIYHCTPSHTLVPPEWVETHSCLSPPPRPPDVQGVENLSILTCISWICSCKMYTSLQDQICINYCRYIKLYIVETMLQWELWCGHSPPIFSLWRCKWKPLRCYKDAVCLIRMRFEANVIFSVLLIHFSVWGETRTIQSTANSLLCSGLGCAFQIFHYQAFGVGPTSATGVFGSNFAWKNLKPGVHSLAIAGCERCKACFDVSAFPPCKLPWKVVIFKMSTKVFKEILYYLTFFFNLWSLNRIESILSDC